MHCHFAHRTCLRVLISYTPRVNYFGCKQTELMMLSLSYLVQIAISCTRLRGLNIFILFQAVAQRKVDRELTVEPF